MYKIEIYDIENTIDVYVKRFWNILLALLLAYAALTALNSLGRGHYLS